MQNECHIPADIEDSLGLLSGTSKSLLNSGLALLSGACHLRGSFWEQEVGGSREAPARTWEQCGSKSTCSVHCVLSRGMRELTFPLALHIWGDSKVPSHCFGVVITQWPCGQYGRGISSAVSIQYLQGRFLGFICFSQGFLFPFCHFSFCNINCSPRSWHSF